MASDHATYPVASRAGKQRSFDNGVSARSFNTQSFHINAHGSFDFTAITYSCHGRSDGNRKDLLRHADGKSFFFRFRGLFALLQDMNSLGKWNVLNSADVWVEDAAEKWSLAECFKISLATYGTRLGN